MYTVEHLANIRLYELERVSPYVRKGSKVLEIGAGMGLQAKQLSELGVRVTAIDVPSSFYKPDQIWPVIEYDGVHIPFPDDYFDVVFSSNVLEHIPHVLSFQAELQRVLKPDGIAIHILPSACWRIASTIAHYAWVVDGAFKHFLKRRSTFEIEEAGNPRSEPANNKPRLIRTLIAPERHGEFGNTITEMYYFSKFRWNRLFNATGWTIEEHSSNRLFYTGYCILGLKLSIRARRLLSYVFGSACHVFILRKAPAPAFAAERVADSGADRRTVAALIKAVVPLYCFASQLCDFSILSDFQIL
ncbi:MAG TPA: class I SAM-dependent methyltransferase [Candidatus Binatia bacterium]|jgi:SAM-dependent methyltransferase